MGCYCSREIIDFDFIQPIVLRVDKGSAVFSGTTERGRCQTFGPAELALTEDCLYSQVQGSRWGGDQGVLRVPILSIIKIEQKSYFNGRYRTDYPHMVLTYVVRDEHGRKEHQAAWQMNNATYNQWKNAIKQAQGRYSPSDLG